MSEKEIFPFGVTATAKQIIEVLSRFRFDLHDVKDTQKQVHDCLVSCIPDRKVIREARISSTDIPDFLIDRIIIEVKLKGTRMNIFSQLSRYAKHSEIDAIILVTNISMGLPRLIENKPAFIVSLGRAWL